MKIFKKIAYTIVSFLLFGAVIAGVANFLPNEIIFKIQNTEGVNAQQSQMFSQADSLYKKAKKMFHPWGLIADNNALGNMYEQKKYNDLKVLLPEIVKQKCSLDNKQIQEYCENIFYLNGLTQYRLGENKDLKDQKTFFEKSIFNFQKVLTINPENTWAKENIDFILQQYQKAQTKQADNKSSEKSSKSDKNQKENQGGTQEKQNREKGGEKGEEKKESNQNSSGQQQSEEEKGGEEQNSSGKQLSEEKGKEKNSKKEGNGEKSEESRLPKQMQQALDKVQQQLEEEQNQSQKGFNRSQSAAERNNIDVSDPFQMFNNDPFFQDFFGNDPFFSDTFRQKKFNKNIQDPNIKDW